MSRFFLQIACVSDQEYAQLFNHTSENAVHTINIYTDNSITDGRFETSFTKMNDTTESKWKMMN